MQTHLLSEELKQQRGPGFWKFNSSLLEDKQDISDLRINLTQFIKKYRNNEGLKWDFAKMEIQGFTLTFLENKARKRRNEEACLKKNLLNHF